MSKLHGTDQSAKSRAWPNNGGQATQPVDRC